MSTRRDSTTDQRQKNQYSLAFPEESRGARACVGGTESELAKRRAESPATEQWMEEVCERENCKQALRRVKANKGSPGIDKLEQWLRRRLRSMVWKQWKRGTTRYRELRQRGIAAQDAARTAGSSDGPWHLANTLALKIALGNAYFNSLGLPELTGTR
jgi:hypothetical protein